jgi:hypothetical protein
MTYKIVKDEKILLDFIKWLPELNESEKYYLCLFARSKYTKDLDGKNGLPHIKSDKAQLKRFVSDKERMFQKIKQLEVPLGWYMQKDLVVPQEALAVYITPNPRHLWRATMNSAVKLVECIRDQNVTVDPHQEVLSEIQRTKSRTCWIDFDIDETDEEKMKVNIEEIKGYVNPEAVKWLKTRGGYHVLVNPDLVWPEFKKTFYRNMAKFADQTGDNMIPIPGCTQGMFVPHFEEL